MYRVGENSVKRRHHRMLLYVVIVGLVIGGVVYAEHWFKANTTIAAPPTRVNTTISANSGKTKSFDEGLFHIDLPSDWKLEGHHVTNLNVYTFQSTNTKLAGRSIDIYMDTIPATMGINRALSVRSNGAEVVPVGDVSDNCASFTSAGSSTTAQTTPAKWNDVPFLCDLSRYERDVVGTVSSDGINKVNLSASSGQHSMFFTYTDNNINPDFSIFINALESFSLE